MSACMYIRMYVFIGQKYATAKTVSARFRNQNATTQ